MLTRVQARAPLWSVAGFRYEGVVASSRPGELVKGSFMTARNTLVSNLPLLFNGSIQLAS